jgi:hypothetical protein
LGQQKAYDAVTGRLCDRPRLAKTMMERITAMTSADIDAHIAQRNALTASLIETEVQLDLLDDEKTERYANVYAENGRLFDLVEDCDTVIWNAPITSWRHAIEKILILLHRINLGWEPADLFSDLWSQLVQSEQLALG